MPQELEEWIAEKVDPYRDRSVAWLSQHHFFRDPFRPIHVDPSYFLSPADGILMYQEVVGDDGHLIDIKGQRYSVSEALRDPGFDRPALVIGIFMTFYDVHVNRVPLGGRLSYRECEPIDTLNRPMLGMEKAIVDRRQVDLDEAAYLRSNQRMVNRIDVAPLDLTYYVLQVADYDVDCITPFCLQQNQPVQQGERFSQIRYGSQVDLVIPLSEKLSFEPLARPGQHVEAGNDALVRITPTR